MPELTRALSAASRLHGLRSDLEPVPVADHDEQARVAYARSYDGYRLAYAEQVALEGE